MNDGRPQADPVASPRPRVASGPPAEAGDLARLRFRFGFCLIDPGAMRASMRRALENRAWSRRALGRFELWAHPEAAVQSLAIPFGRCVFVGDAYPEVEETLQAAVAAVEPGDDAALFDAIDGIGGRFALLVAEGDRVRVFHDPIGARSVFYHDRAPFAVASHARLLAACVGAGKCPTMARYMALPEFKSRKTKCLAGDRTIYQDVQALVPNNLFDSRTMSTCRYWPRQPRQPGGTDAFVAAADAALAALGRFAAGRYTPVFGLTGGVDTRAAFAAFARFGIPFETITWRRERLSRVEIGIIDRLRANIDAPHSDITEAADPGPVGRVAAENAGGFQKPSHLARALHDALGERRDRVFVRGWGAEIMRGFYNLWSSRMQALDPEEMARAYLGAKGPNLPGTLAAFSDFHRRGNYAGVERFGYDQNDLFYWEHRMGMWGASVNSALDVAVPTLIAFNSRRLFEAALALPDERRLSKRLLLGYAERNAPALAGIPITRPTVGHAARLRGLGDATSGGLAAAAPARASGFVAGLTRSLSRWVRRAPGG